MNIVRVPGWGFDYSEARYYGWRHCLHIGRRLIFFGRMTDAELQAWHAEHMAAGGREIRKGKLR